MDYKPNKCSEYDDCRDCPEIISCQLRPISRIIAQGNPQEAPALELQMWDEQAEQISKKARAHICGDPNDACDMLCLGNASECHSEGINGNCGEDCPVLVRGECTEEWDIDLDKVQAPMV